MRKKTGSECCAASCLSFYILNKSSKTSSFHDRTPTVVCHTAAGVLPFYEKELEPLLRRATAPTLKEECLIWVKTDEY